MYRGKRVKQSSSRKKSAALVASLVLILGVAVSGVVAFLVDSSGPVENTFLPSEVPPHIVEEFDGTTKSNVQIKNDGDVDAYIRAAIVVNWVKDGNVYGQKPVENTDYTMQLNLQADAEKDYNKWVKNGDYYYWTGKISADGYTGMLISECKLKDGATVPDGYSLSVEILAQSIQADGQDSEGRKPVQLAWGVTIDETAGTVTTYTPSSGT